MEGTLKITKRVVKKEVEVAAPRISRIAVKKNCAAVISLLDSGAGYEAFRLLRHSHSNYDAVWKTTPSNKYHEVAEDLRVAVIEAYPSLAKIVCKWKF